VAASMASGDETHARWRAAAKSYLHGLSTLRLIGTGQFLSAIVFEELHRRSAAAKQAAFPDGTHGLMAQAVAAAAVAALADADADATATKTDTAATSSSTSHASSASDASPGRRNKSSSRKSSPDTRTVKIALESEATPTGKQPVARPASSSSSSSEPAGSAAAAAAAASSSATDSALEEARRQRRAMVDAWKAQQKHQKELDKRQPPKKTLAQEVRACVHACCVCCLMSDQK
jgi:hypothetical protein